MCTPNIPRNNSSLLNQMTLSSLQKIFHLLEYLLHSLTFCQSSSCHQNSPLCWQSFEHLSHISFSLCCRSNDVFLFCYIWKNINKGLEGLKYFLSSRIVSFWLKDLKLILKTKFWYFVSIERLLKVLLWYRRKNNVFNGFDKILKKVRITINLTIMVCSR